ncbi:MAG: hypothetical protein EPO11_07165 [Gammaproteobacteria bacterium]|nr:MAG: hypothetical protein EPO11_07165 [Gammaproteobacteria bacterium]
MLKKYGMVTTFLISLFLLSNGYAEAPDIVKLALLDGPYKEMPLVPYLSEYEKAYFAGVEVAAKIAKKYNVEIKYKSFLYGKGSLDILAEIPKISQWQPDLIIGPNSSDQVLLLRNYFPNVMVLSAYASGDALQSLPKNFYSTFLPDSRIMELLSKFVKTKFPQRNIYIIVQTDCKQCVDASRLFIANHKKISSATKITENKLIMDDIKSIDSRRLMVGHTDDVILVFNDAYYAYNVFVTHIISSFPNKDLIFISDQDNWSNEVDGQVHKFDLTYESYRIGPILFDNNLLEFKNFSEAYYQNYNKKPSDAISYLTYRTILSAIEALHQFHPSILNKNMRERVLYSYFAALQKNPDWFRSNAYGIYRLTSKGEVLVEKLSIS